MPPDLSNKNLPIIGRFRLSTKSEVKASDFVVYGNTVSLADQLICFAGPRKRSEQLFVIFPPDTVFGFKLPFFQIGFICRPGPDVSDISALKAESLTSLNARKIIQLAGSASDLAIKHKFLLFG